MTGKVTLIFQGFPDAVGTLLIAAWKQRIISITLKFHSLPTHCTITQRYLDGIPASFLLPHVHCVLITWPELIRWLGRVMCHTDPRPRSRPGCGWLQ